MILEIAKKLIAIPSVTPDDKGCMEVICSLLEPDGFASTRLDFEDVNNLWMSHGETGPILCFLGHTDVVPAGPEDQWDTDPFIPDIKRWLFIRSWCGRYERQYRCDGIRFAKIRK